MSEWCEAAMWLSIRTEAPKKRPASGARLGGWTGPPCLQPAPQMGQLLGWPVFDQPGEIQPDQGDDVGDGEPVRGDELMLGQPSVQWSS